MEFDITGCGIDCYHQQHRFPVQTAEMQMNAHEATDSLKPACNGIPADRLATARWRKSARSNPTGACVELAELPDGRIAMRNSRFPSGPALIYSRAAIATLIAKARNGGL